MPNWVAGDWPGPAEEEEAADEDRPKLFIRPMQSKPTEGNAATLGAAECKRPAGKLGANWPEFAAKK